MKGMNPMLILVEDIKGSKVLLNTDKIIRVVETFPTKIEDLVRIVAYLDHSDEAIIFNKIAYTYHDQSVEFRQVKSLTDFYLFLSEMQN